MSVTMMVAPEETLLAAGGKKDGPIASWLKKRKSQKGLYAIAATRPIIPPAPITPTSPLFPSPTSRPLPPQASTRSFSLPFAEPSLYEPPPTDPFVSGYPPHATSTPNTPLKINRKASTETTRSSVATRQPSTKNLKLRSPRHKKSGEIPRSSPTSKQILTNGDPSSKSPTREASSSNLEEPSTPTKIPKSPALTSSAERTPGRLHLPLAFTKLTRDRGFSTSATRAQPTPASSEPLRPSTSIPDYNPVGSFNPRNRPRTPSHYRPDRGLTPPGADRSANRHDLSGRQDNNGHEEVRASFRSALTTTSSFLGNSSGTERSSVMTKSSSTSDFSNGFLGGNGDKGGGMSVDEAISMYEKGFNDGDTTQDFDGIIGPVETEEHGNSIRLADAMNGTIGDFSPKRPATSPQTQESAFKRPESMLLKASPPSALPSSAPTSAPPEPRDRYGFRKASQYVTLDQYNSWNGPYTECLVRRRKKWIDLLAESGLSSERPVQFPTPSPKVKRYIRKGIPPEWRGAAWFWYAGGHARIQRYPGLYDELVQRAKTGQMSESDKELIERDLHRTFPDNVKFKPDPSPMEDATNKADGQARNISDPTEPETPMLQCLRRVLQAFSIHNPKIGYCQSLNFLAGLLLLFMDEEKAFWMLDIITQVYLPGTHEVNLEGANVDLAVLMASIKESMPAIWAKIGGELDGSSGADRASTRLPPITLCTTAWFMSCFIGTLPIETVLRVWDSFFYESSKTLFRVALAIFKVGEQEIRAVSDSMEIFQVVQTIPRRLIDASALMEACFKRRNGFGHLSQETIDERRRGWRVVYAKERAMLSTADSALAEENQASLRKDLRRMNSRARLKKMHLVR